MAQNPLGPPPFVKQEGAFDRWMRLMYQRIIESGQILWSQLDLTESSLIDLGTRNHNDLQNIQGGTTSQYYHLTSAHHTDLTDSGDSSLHYHSADRALGSATGTLAVANGGTGQVTYTDGQILIGNSTGNTLAKTTITAGTGISVANGSGTITISATSSTVPAGVVAPYAGSSAPSGWLLCYGQAVSRTTYADLFTAIGTTYGTGDGSTTFNMPDLRGRVAAGKDDMGGSSASRITSGGSGIAGSTLGATGGTQTHTLTAGQMPSHTHDLDGYYMSSATGGTMGFTTGSRYQWQTSESAGGDQAHQNTQPTIILNYIIKT